MSEEYVQEEFLGEESMGENMWVKSMCKKSFWVKSLWVKSIWAKSMCKKGFCLKSLWVKNIGEHRDRWDAGFRSPLLRSKVSPGHIFTDHISRKPYLPTKHRTKDLTISNPKKNRNPHQSWHAFFTGGAYCRR